MPEDTARFAARYKSATKLHKSGYSYDDTVRHATAMFNKVKVSHPREDVKKFCFLKCWELFRERPKFMAAANGGSSEKH